MSFDYIFGGKCKKCGRDLKGLDFCYECGRLMNEITIESEEEQYYRRVALHITETLGFVLGFPPSWFELSHAWNFLL